MSKRGTDLLLTKYFKQGWLKRRYYGEDGYRQPYSAEDRLWAGRCFYADFSCWRGASFALKAVDLTRPKTDGGLLKNDVSAGIATERFRKALRHVSKSSLPVIYKIVLEEREIKAPAGLSEREKLYFNDEIKGLLCRGLDDLIPYYLKLL